MPSFYREQLEKYLKTISIKEGKVLDVGGSQNPINRRLNVFEADEHDILDLAEPHEVSKHPDIILDLNVTTKEKPRPHSKYSNRYDVAFCIEVSEYWWRPYIALEHIHWFMKKGAKLYITFCYVYGIHNPRGQDMLRYTPDGAEKLLDEAGFKIKKHIYRKPLMGNSLFEFMIRERMRIRHDVDQNITGSIIIAEKK